MLSEYFLVKTATEKFKKELRTVINELVGKKVIIYGAGDGYLYLKERYAFDSLNIVAIADKKFNKEAKFNEFKAIPPEEILKQDYDVILVTNEQPIPILNYLKKTLSINGKQIKTVFQEEISEERLSCNYLGEFKFRATLKKLIKKLKNKPVLIYGSGIFFETIQNYYDLRGLNIIGIADRKFEGHKEGEVFLGYTVYSPSEIKGLNPDYVLVATKFYINIIENLYYETLKDTKIKIKPLVKKTFWTLIREIWC